MSTAKPRSLLRIEYEKAAEAYLHSLPPEHFMEATPQATQRKITLESFDLIHVHRPDIQMFNELLIQYPLPRRAQIRQVVPDNMALLHDEPIQAKGSFDVPLQPVKPFLTMEYVSKRSQRKDYEDSFRKYERELKVPYYLLFYPDEQELSLYRHNGKKYVSVKPNAAGRYAIPDMELEVALLDGWVRFWFRGALLPLPPDLLRELEEVRRQLDRTREQLDQTREQLDQTREQLTEQKRREEQLLAQLRELGIEPRL